MLKREANARFLLGHAPKSSSSSVLIKLGYPVKFEIDDHRARKTAVNPIGRLNKCGVISA